MHGSNNMRWNKVIITMAILSIIATVALQQKWWDFRPYRKIPLAHLNTIYLDELQRIIKIQDEYLLLRNELVSNDSLPPEKEVRFFELRRELKRHNRERLQMKAEIIIKKYHVDLSVALIAGISSIYLIVMGSRMFFNRLPAIVRRRKKVRGRIIEDPPQEIYISPSEVRRSVETGFLTRKEAINWLRYNPSFWCSYCGGRLKGEYVGRIQKVTFLRNPPEGARDLKITLAELWYAHPVPKAKCTRCGRIVEF